LSCECNISGLLSSSIRGIFSAAINGNTVIEVSENGTVLLGQTVSNLTIGAYAFLPGQDKYLGATCPVEAQASTPWITKEDCATGKIHFIPKTGGSASITNRSASGISSSIIDLNCNPGVVSKSFSASSSSGPATPFFFSDREDGYNLVYNGHPISVQTGVPQRYLISLGFVGTIEAFLQSFSLTVNPPSPATVQYSFVFAGSIS